MKRIRLKPQAGFTVVEVLLGTVVLAALVVAAATVYNHSSSSPVPIGLRGQFEAENGTLVLDQKQGGNFNNQYYLSFRFQDSVKDDPCPEAVEGFKGKLTIRYDNPDQATVDITQNSKPLTERPQNNDEPVACPAVVVPAYDAQTTIKKDWLETGNRSKRVIINGRPYSLTIDRDAYKIILSNGGKTTTSLYTPNQVTTLSGAAVCYTAASLEEFAKSHDIELASTKYPGIDQQLAQLWGERNKMNGTVRIPIIASENARAFYGGSGGDCRVQTASDGMFIPLDQGITFNKSD